MSKLGRKYAQTAAVDTRPGKILLCGLVANAPILLGFVLAPLFSGGSPTAAYPFIPYVLYGTPIVAVAAVAFYATGKPTARAHRAARMGLLLSLVALALWALVLLLVLRR